MTTVARAAAVLLATVALAACGEDGSRDGWTPIATGDTYGEWELSAEYDDGDWTGCLRIDHYDGVEECADPGADDLVTFESDGATFGAVPAGAELEFADGDEIALIDRRFFVVARTPRSTSPANR